MPQQWNNTAIASPLFQIMPSLNPMLISCWLFTFEQASIKYHMESYFLTSTSDSVIYVSLNMLTYQCYVCDIEHRLTKMFKSSWWRHQMETFSALLAICAGNSPVYGEFPAQRPVTRSFDVFSDVRPNKQLSKQSWGWWFETPGWSLWRHRNDECCCQQHLWI